MNLAAALRFAGLRAVLFDLDGTLADTAPDLAAAANAMRLARALAPLPLSLLRPVASHGARGLLRIALERTPEDSDYEALRVEFLTRYEHALDVHTRLFDGMTNVLDALEAHGLRWGIVTNKAARFTAPLVESLHLTRRATSVVSGDTTPHAKPHPAPLLHAAVQMGVAPEVCIYVGDDLRDIVAGRAAGMRTAAAAWGYCADGDPHGWGADTVVETPLDLLALLV